MAADLEMEVQVLEKAIGNFERRIELELAQVEKGVDLQLGQVDQQLREALEGVSRQLGSDVKGRSKVTEEELDEAIRAAEEAISRAQQSLGQASSPVNTAAIDSFRANLQSAFTQLDSFYDTSLNQLRATKDEATKYIADFLPPYSPSMEQFSQEQMDAASALWQQLNSQ